MLKNEQVLRMLESDPDYMSGENLGKLIIWFNNVKLEDIYYFGKINLKRLENMVSFVYIEIDVDRNKIELLRKYIDN